MITLINKLARTSKWQTLLSLSKEVNGIRLFNNTKDLTYLQLLFINRLYTYHNALLEVELGHMPEWAYKKDLYIEAYNEYKSRRNKKKDKSDDKSIITPYSKYSSKKTTGFKVLFK